MITKGPFFKSKFKTGFPIFPPNLTLILFFFKTCSRILHVVDFPFVPVTTIVFICGLKRYKRSRSVIILSLFSISVYLSFAFLKINPGLTIIKSAKSISCEKNLFPSFSAV